VRPERIAHRLTAEEAFWLDPCEYWELVEGRIVQMSPTRWRHGKVLRRLARSLDEFVEAHDLGEIYVGDVGFVLRRDPDTVRGPDLAFVRKERVAAVEASETFSEVMPDLCAEILSPSDRWADVERKVAEYLAAGVPVIWAIDPNGPQGLTARIYSPGQPPRTLGEGDALEDPDLFPGWRLGLADLFR
jgi:Uma2 family endonuclease